MGTKLSNPRVRVVMMDGAEWEAQSLNPDLLRFERTAAKYKWAEPKQSPVTWLTFMAWSAGLREGHIPQSMTWDMFREECAEVVNADKVDAVPVDPTDPGPDID